MPAFENRPYSRWINIKNVSSDLMKNLTIKFIQDDGTSGILRLGNLERDKQIDVDLNKHKLRIAKFVLIYGVDGDSFLRVSKQQEPALGIYYNWFRLEVSDGAAFTGMGRSQGNPSPAYSRESFEKTASDEMTIFTSLPVYPDFPVNPVEIQDNLSTKFIEIINISGETIKLNSVTVASGVTSKTVSYNKNINDQQFLNLEFQPSELQVLDITISYVKNGKNYKFSARIPLDWAYIGSLFITNDPNIPIIFDAISGDDFSFYTFPELTEEEESAVKDPSCKIEIYTTQYYPGYWNATRVRNTSLLNKKVKIEIEMRFKQNQGAFSKWALLNTFTLSKNGSQHLGYGIFQWPPPSILTYTHEWRVKSIRYI